MPAFRREQRINSLEPAWPTEGSPCLRQKKEGKKWKKKSFTFKNVDKIQISTKIMRFTFKYLASMEFSGVFYQLSWLETTESTLCCLNRKGFMLLAPGHKMLGGWFFKFGWYPTKSNLRFIPHRVVKQGFTTHPTLPQHPRPPPPPPPPKTDPEAALCCHSQWQAGL